MKNLSLPQCPSYVAHPQAVWFETHWRPKFIALEAEIEHLQSVVSKQKAEYNDILEPIFQKKLTDCEKELNKANEILGLHKWNDLITMLRKVVSHPIPAHDHVKVLTEIATLRALCKATLKDCGVEI